MDTVDIQDLFDAIKRRPGFYIDGDKSLKRVRSFLVGYEGGSCSTSRELTDREKFHQLHDWVAKRLGYVESTSGWCNMITSRAGSDERGFEMFFELLDEFRRRERGDSAKPE